MSVHGAIRVRGHEHQAGTGDTRFTVRLCDIGGGAVVRQEEDVDFWRSPAMWNQRMAVHARAFYTAEALGRLEELHTPIFTAMNVEKKALADEAELADFFAKFGQQQTRKARIASAHYLLGLGLLGQGKTEEARRELDKATQMNLAQPWAAYYANAAAD